jgi:hypothetical protein
MGGNERRDFISPFYAGKCRDEDCYCVGESGTNNNPNTAFAESVWKLVDQLGNLLITKQFDYGPGNINNAYGGPMNGLLVRIGDKFERLKNLYSTGETPKHEAIKDSWMDLANYAIIAMMVIEESWPENKGDK